MDLGTRGTATAVSTASLLSWIADDAEVRDHLLIREWMNIAAWVEANIVESPEGAATLTEGYLDTGVPIAGPGAPLVSEFQLMELVAVLGRSPDGGRSYVGQVVECAWRLPLLYAAVVDGRVAPWRAQRIADLTRSLPEQAAGFVDRHLNAAVGGVGWAQLERLVTEAILRFDPERAEAERQAANEHRHCNVTDTDEHGGVHLDAYLDAADGHDFNLAVAREAHLRGQLGDESSLDVRRAKAVGAIARRDLALDLLIADETTGEVIAQAPGRRVELNVHITDTVLADDVPGSRDGRCATSSTTNTVGRWDEGRCPSPPHRSGNGSRSRAPPSSSDRSSTWPTAFRSTRTRSPTATNDASASATTPAGSPTAPTKRSAATSTTPNPTPRAARPAPATSSHSADGTTAPRPTANGATRSPAPATTCGPAPTATTSTSAPPAQHHSTATDHHAPRPAGVGGAIGTPALPRRP